MKRMVMMVVLVSMIGCVKPQYEQEARVREALPLKTTAERMFEFAEENEQMANELESLADSSTDPASAEDMRNIAKELRGSAARLREEAENGRPAE